MAFWEIYSYFYALSLKNLFPYRRLLEDLSIALDIKEGDAILDAGCGPGLLIEKILQENRGRSIGVTGLDLGRRMIDHARRTCRGFPNVRLQIADLNKSLQLPDGSFDKVICAHTLYTLEDPRTAISEFYRVLKAGGAVVIANPKPGAGQKELIADHIRAIDELSHAYKRMYHALLSLFLIPVHIVVIVINRVIVEKGGSREYHFWDQEDLRNVLQEAGFENICISSCYADQDWLVKAEKQP